MSDEIIQQGDERLLLLPRKLGNWCCELGETDRGMLMALMMKIAKVHQTGERVAVTYRDGEVYVISEKREG